MVAEHEYKNGESTLKVIATFKAKRGEEGRALDALRDMIRPSLAEAGCLGYQPYVHPDTPATIVLVEEWVDAAALDAHFATPHFAAVEATLNEVLAEPFRLERLHSIPA